MKHAKIDKDRQTLKDMIDSYLKTGRDRHNLIYQTSVVDQTKRERHKKSNK